MEIKVEREKKREIGKQRLSCRVTAFIGRQL